MPKLRENHIIPDFQFPVFSESILTFLLERSLYQVEEYVNFRQSERLLLSSLLLSENN